MATRVGTGLAVVGPIRQEQRQSVQVLLQHNIVTAYAAQLENLQAASAQRLQKALLKLINV